MEQMTNPAPAGTPAADTGSTAKIIYILYLVSLVLGVTAIVGLVMAYVYQGQGQAWVQTHYRFQIRTFWILILASFVALLLTFVVIGLVLWPLILVWLVVRCVRGIMTVDKQQPYPNPASWLW